MSSADRANVGGALLFRSIFVSIYWRVGFSAYDMPNHLHMRSWPAHCEFAFLLLTLAPILLFPSFWLPGRRSESRDIEAQAALVTDNPQLRAALAKVSF